MRSVSARDPNLNTIRLRIPLGIIYPEQLDTLREVSLRYGDGRLHLTVRKTIEIPGVPFKSLGPAHGLLSRAGWYANAFGNNVRNITACPGRYSCTQAQIDTHGLGLELDSALYHLENLPAKIKIAIAGCPNGCTHPLINDIGVVGISRISIQRENCQHCLKCIEFCREDAIKTDLNGEVIIDYDKCNDCGECLSSCDYSAIICEGNYFRLFLGGKMGRNPQFAKHYGDFISLPELLGQIEKIIAVYYQYAAKDERLGILINRLSMDIFKKYVAECKSKKPLDCVHKDLLLVGEPGTK